MSNILSKAQKRTLNQYSNKLIDICNIIARYPSALFGIAVLGLFTLMAVFAPIFAPYEPGERHVTSEGDVKNLQPPSTDHIFGTTHQGQDIFSQWVFGAQVSLLVAFLSGIAIMVIGGSIGLIAGYYKGTVDEILMRIVDVLYGIPTMPLILVIAMFFGSSVWNVILAMVLVLWRSMARIVRSEALSVSERPFIKAARATGASDLRIIYLHVAPNILPIIIIETILIMAWAIVLEASISFLGFGAQEMISWGSMLQVTFATGAIRSAWWWVIPPGLSIMFLVLSFFYISRALEAVTNPELRNKS